MSGSSLFIVRALKFFLHSLNEPNTLPNRQKISFFITKPSIIHQNEYLLEVYFFISRRQAKKMRPPWEAVPPMIPYSVNNPSMFSYLTQAQKNQHVSSMQENLLRACS